MPRKTQNTKVLERIGTSQTTAPAQVVERVSASPRPVTTKGITLSTYVAEALPALRDLAIEAAPGRKDDNINKEFAEAAFYRTVENLAKKGYETKVKALKESGAILTPDSEPGEKVLGASSGFNVTATVSQPRAAFDVEHLAQALFKQYKVPLHTTRELCDAAKQPIGAKQTIIRFTEKTESAILRDAGVPVDKTKARTPAKAVKPKSRKKAVITALLGALCLTTLLLPSPANAQFVFLRWEDVRPTHERLQRMKRPHALKSRTIGTKAYVSPTVSRVDGPAAAFVQPVPATGMPIW